MSSLLQSLSPQIAFVTPAAHLCVGEVCDCVPVCGDEQAAGVLPDAQCGILDLVVVDVAVKTHHHSTNLQMHSRCMFTWLNSGNDCKLDGVWAYK
jgi:hypothetical protein